MTAEQLDQVMEGLQTAVFNGDCYGCGKQMKVLAERVSDVEINVTGGALFRAPSKWDMNNQILCKCPECYEKNPTWGRPTTIYSRIVGYFSPVKNWHDSKREEFRMRKTYKIEGLT